LSVLSGGLRHAGPPGPRCRWDDRHLAAAAPRAKGRHRVPLGGTGGATAGSRRSRVHRGVAGATGLQDIHTRVQVNLFTRAVRRHRLGVRRAVTVGQPGPRSRRVPRPVRWLSPLPLRGRGCLGGLIEGAPLKQGCRECLVHARCSGRTHGATPFRCRRRRVRRALARRSRRVRTEGLDGDRTAGSCAANHSRGRSDDQGCGGEWACKVRMPVDEAGIGWACGINCCEVRRPERRARQR
jgi:hypothetical protein